MSKIPYNLESRTHSFFRKTLAIYLSVFSLVVWVSPSTSFGMGEADAAEKVRAEAWIRDQITWDPDQRIPPLVVIKFSTTRRTTKSLAEIEKLKSEIKAFPNHPKQADVQNWSRLTKHEQVSRHAIWLSDDRLWRLCSDRNDGETATFSDRGQNKSEAWELTPGHLGTLDNAALALPQLRNPPAVLKSLILSSVQRFFGGLGHLPMGSPRVETLVKDQGQWLATVYSTTGRHRIWFDWISECNAFFPTKVEVLANADSSVMTTWSYERPSQGFDQQPVCKRVVYASPGTGHMETYSLESCESTTADEVVLHARTPAPDQVDAVRGAASIRVISYANGSDSFVKSITPQGEVISRVPTPEELLAQPSRTLWYVSSLIAVVVVGSVLTWKWKSF